MSSMETTPRFLRPSDVDRVRRNQKRIDVQRYLGLARALAIIAALGVAVLWAYRHTQSNGRFAVRTVDIVGAVHTSRQDMDSIVRRYTGVNLFQIDIARVQQDLGSLTWVRRIEIEKKLPDTLRIRIVERVPVALVRTGKSFRYVDEEGLAFAFLSTAAGNDDLPIVDNANRAELKQTIDFIAAVRRHDPAVYSRISEIRPIAPRGFMIFDRDLAAPIYVNGDDVSIKVRNLYAIAKAEGLGRGSIEYADLRFAERVIIKPSRSSPAASRPPLPGGEGLQTPLITN